MRAITDHHDGHGLAESITIEADDLDPHSGAASHEYHGFIRHEDRKGESHSKVLTVYFQHGPRGVSGSTPGITDSVLLAIVADRMRCFNAGPYKCRENALVLTKIEEAMHWLKHRADERAKRGVLGKNEP